MATVILSDSELTKHMEDARDWALKKYNARRVTVSGWRIQMEDGPKRDVAVLVVLVRAAHYDGQTSKDEYRVGLA